MWQKSFTTSPPRFTEKCKAFGLLSGYAVGLETGWDLMDKTQVKWSWTMKIRTWLQEAHLVIRCRFYKDWAKEEWTQRNSKQDWKKEKRCWKHHVRSTNKGSRKGSISYMNIRSQQSRGKKSASEEIGGMPSIEIVEGPMCRWKMAGRDVFGEGYIRKPTCWMTNPPELAETLRGVCTNDLPGGKHEWHRHIHLVT